MDKTELINMMAAITGLDQLTPTTQPDGQDCPGSSDERTHCAQSAQEPERSRPRSARTTSFPIRYARTSTIDGTSRVCVRNATSRKESETEKQ